MCMTLTGTAGSSIVNFTLSGSDAATASFSSGVSGAFMFNITDTFKPFPQSINGSVSPYGKYSWQAVAER